MGRSRFKPEERIAAVEEYLAGKIGRTVVTKKLGIADITFQTWVRIYRTVGPDGLIEKQKNKQYTSSQKKEAVEAYLNGEGSQGDICERYNISSRAILQNWIKLYLHQEVLKSYDFRTFSLLKQQFLTFFSHFLNLPRNPVFLRNF